MSIPRDRYRAGRDRTDRSGIRPRVIGRARRIAVAFVGMAAAAVVTAGISGCAYERYDIVVGDYMLEGIALGDWRGVRKVGETIRLAPGARFAIKVDDQTQYLAQFNVAILSGTGATFYSRVVSHDFDPADGVAFRYAVDGCTVRTEDGTVIPLEYNADIAEQTVKVLVEAHQMEFWIGCDKVFESPAALDATEYIIIETLPDTELEIQAINYFDIDEL